MEVPAYRCHICRQFARAAVVAQFDFALHWEEGVRRLHVSVDDALRVQKGQAASQLPKEPVNKFNIRMIYCSLNYSGASTLWSFFVPLNASINAKNYDKWLIMYKQE